MKHFLADRCAALAAGGAAVMFLSAGAGVANAATASDLCPPAAVTQPFQQFHDNGDYTLAPGEAADSFAGTGWTLTGGATITATPLLDGSTGTVLTLPPGSAATSPPMCVQTGMPLARMLTQTLGNQPTTKTTFFAELAGSNKLSGGAPVLAKPSWQLSPPVKVAPGLNGSQQMQFTYVAGDQNATVQIYDLYVDPRCH
jgi:hypothetical protein